MLPSEVWLGSYPLSRITSPRPVRAHVQTLPAFTIGAVAMFVAAIAFVAAVSARKAGRLWKPLGVVFLLVHVADANAVNYAAMRLIGLVHASVLAPGVHGCVLDGTAGLDSTLRAGAARRGRDSVKSHHLASVAGRRFSAGGGYGAGGPRSVRRLCSFTCSRCPKLSKRGLFLRITFA